MEAITLHTGRSESRLCCVYYTISSAQLRCIANVYLQRMYYYAEPGCNQRRPGHLLGPGEGKWLEALAQPTLQHSHGSTGRHRGLQSHLLQASKPRPTHFTALARPHTAMAAS